MASTKGSTVLASSARLSASCTGAVARLRGTQHLELHQHTSRVHLLSVTEVFMQHTTRTARKMTAWSAASQAVNQVEGRTA